MEKMKLKLRVEKQTNQMLKEQLDEMRLKGSNFAQSTVHLSYFTCRVRD